MSDFDNSRWSDSNFSQAYRAGADDYIPDRYRMIEITRSLYKHFFSMSRTKSILDLGCGDGLLVHKLLEIDDSIHATLVDGSSDMLEAARKRLADFDNIQFIQVGFQELLTEDPLSVTFDCILSSFAIHHLSMHDKSALFQYSYAHLNQGGMFLNIDVVLAPTDSLEQWYLSLWSDWIDTNVDDSKKSDVLPIPKQYKDNGDNMPDTLSAQLSALESIGFVDVDCYYKYGIFTMFGGRKA